MPQPIANLSPAGLPSARTPLAHWHSQNGARFDEINSCPIPMVYSSEDQEVEAARTRLALADISFTSKLMVHGPGVTELAKSLTGDQISKPGNARPLKADQSVLICLLQPDQMLLLVDPSSKIRLDQVLSKIGKTPTFRQSDVTSTFAAMWFFGPHTDEVFCQLTHHDVAAMPPGTCAETGLAGCRAILIRPPSPKAPSIRVLIGWDVAEYAWTRLWEAGQTWNISALGMDALDVLLK